MLSCKTRFERMKKFFAYHHNNSEECACTPLPPHRRGHCLTLFEDL